LHLARQVLDDLPAPCAMEEAGIGWLQGEFPFSHGRTIITTRAAAWEQEEEDSREVSAAEQRKCDRCGCCGLSGTMQKCGRCRMVYYCSVDCQTAAWGEHKGVCAPRRSVVDVTGLSVGSFGEEEACSWIQSTVRQWRGDDAGVLELVRHAGCLPLAVGLVSAFANTHKTATAGELLAELKRAAPTAAAEGEGLRKGARVELHSLNTAELNGKQGELLEYDAVAGRWGVKLSPEERLKVRPANLAVLSRGDECPPSLAAVVKLSMGAIRESTDRDGKAAEEALRKMALCDTTGIPLELLSPSEKQAVTLLTQHALVTKDKKGLATMHALTQRAVRGLTDRAERGALAAAVAGALAAKLLKFDRQKPATYFIGRRFAAHAMAAAAQARAWGLLRPPRGAAGGGVGLLQDVFTMCTKAGNFLGDVCGQNGQALGMYQVAQDCGLALHGPEHHLLSLTHSNMGTVCRLQGRYEEALVHFGKAVEIDTKIKGSGHVDIARSHANIGIVRRAQGDFEKALLHLGQAQEVFEAALGAENTLSADTWINMANVYSQQGDYEKALFHYGKAQEVYLAVFGDRHPQVASTHVNMGVVYSRLDRFEEAIFHYGKAQEVHVAVYGDMHPNVATGHVGLGNVRKAQGDYDKALFHYGKAQEVFVAVYGDVHPDTAATLSSMATVYEQQGDYEKALFNHGKAQEVFVAVYGDGHTDVAKSDNSLGNVYQELGDYEKALFHYGKSREVFVAEGEHLHVADTRNNVANVYYAQGRYEEALEEHSKVLDIRVSALGPDHEDVADTKYNMAAVHKKRGEREVAKQLLLECEAIFAKVFGADHDKTRHVAQQARDCA